MKRRTTYERWVLLVAYAAFIVRPCPVSTSERSNVDAEIHAKRETCSSEEEVRQITALVSELDQALTSSGRTLINSPVCQRHLQVAASTSAVGLLHGLSSASSQPASQQLLAVDFRFQ